MRVVFLTMVNITSMNTRGIYEDLLNHFLKEGHEVYIISPSERRFKKKTELTKEGKATLIRVKTLNLQKASLIEKGIGQLLVEYQYLNAIKKYLKGVSIDLVLYSTPPITFSKVIHYLKKRDGAFSYLLLKDIFPQNAVDMGFIKKGSLLHRFFVKKEKRLYALSDKMGCMSVANMDYILLHNPEVNQQKVEVNPNSIQPVSITYSDEEKNGIREKYNIPIDKKIFIYGGNLGVPQGLDFLLDAIDTLKEANAHIVVVGSGTQFDKIQKWFNEKKPSQASLLSGLPKDDYDRLLGACDVGLIFLHKDFTIPNFPSRLLSYLENRMPVIAATDVNTDMGRVIEKAGCGYWVEAGDITGMQNAISKLTNENAEFIQMQEKAWELLQSEYLVSNSYQLILRAMEKVASLRSQ